MLNGDHKLNFYEKIIWLLVNFIKNITIFNKYEDYWKIFILDRKTLNDQLRKTYLTSSPSRRLCDMFWNTLPWNEIQKLLGNKVSALEIGCGKGGYGIRLNDLIENFDYLGCDILKREEWDERSSKRISFKVSNSTNVKKYLKCKNFVFTQSAVEHFEFDQSFFSDIQNHISNISHPFLQIHLMPSPSCLWKYLWHGYRQYSVKKINKIKDKIWSKEKLIAVKLGGSKCNKIHFKYITLPMILNRKSLRERNLNKYNKLVENAIKEDFKDKRPKHASFYALLIFSNVKVPNNLKLN